MGIERTTMDNITGSGAKKHSPAAERNRVPILAALRNELPASGTVLEIASGSGEHAAYFAEHLPQLAWQPSDPDKEALTSIAAYREDYKGENLLEPVLLDAARPDTWPVREADALVCINMTQVSPWAATEGLFVGAEQVLGKSGGPLILYGPFIEPGVETSSSNLEFDASLKARNSEWGLRDASKVVELAKAHGFNWKARYKMPANNITLVFTRQV